MNTRTHSSNDFLPYLVPFGIFFLFTYLPSLIDISPLIAYPLKTILVAGVLLIYARGYREDIKLCFSLSALLAGILVFLLWILSEGLYPQLGSSTGFDPFAAGDIRVAWVFITFRLAGTALVVPVMEELFWRSFALRYLINSKFKYVPQGQFSWFSFLFVSLAFGFEHHRWLPGIAAGMVYAGLLYRSKNLFDPILAHAVTNLLLGIYVLMTKQWTFW